MHPVREQSEAWEGHLPDHPDRPSPATAVESKEMLKKFGSIRYSTPQDAYWSFQPLIAKEWIELRSDLCSSCRTEAILSHGSSALRRPLPNCRWRPETISTSALNPGGLTR